MSTNNASVPFFYFSQIYEYAHISFLLIFKVYVRLYVQLQSICKKQRQSLRGVL